ncbi:MAG TPA: hypothetical protein VLZ74_02865 [Methylocella sp.]|nr:hypothetical protein [Methylocella sp.]
MPKASLARACIVLEGRRHPRGRLGIVGVGYGDRAWIERELDAAVDERVGVASSRGAPPACHLSSRETEALPDKASDFIV